MLLLPKAAGGSLPISGISGQRPFQVGPVDKLKINDLPYGIVIISIFGGHFYAGKIKRTNPNDNSGYK